MDTMELQLVAAECKSACAGEPDLEKRIKKAMAVVKDGHWMFPGERYADLRFRGALAAVMLAEETTEDEKARVSNSLKQLRSLSALLNGIPVDTEAMLKEQEENPPLPLMTWWHEVKPA